MHQTSIALGLFALGVSLVAPAAWAQQAAKDPVQVSGPDLEAWLARGFVFAGHNHASGCVFITLGEASKRTQFRSCPNGNSDTISGTQRVAGGMICSVWANTAEQCREWYQVGENKYIQRTKGSTATLVTLYIIK